MRHGSRIELGLSTSTLSKPACTRLPWLVRPIIGVNSMSWQMPLKDSSQASFGRVQTAMCSSSSGVQPLIRPR